MCHNTKQNEPAKADRAKIGIVLGHAITRLVENPWRDRLLANNVSFRGGSFYAGVGASDVSFAAATDCPAHMVAWSATERIISSNGHAAKKLLGGYWF